jgi:Na+/phosphate symporter
MLKKRATQKLVDEEDSIKDEDALEEIIEKSSKQLIRAMVFSNRIISGGIDSFIKEKRNGLKKVEEECQTFSKKAKKNKDKVYSTVQKLSESSVDTSHFYVQMMEHKREMAHALHFMLSPMITHIENNHKPFIPEQCDELNEIANKVDSFFNEVLNVIKKENFDELNNLIVKRDNILEILNKYEKAQIKRIKGKAVNTRNSQLYFKIISEIEQLLLHSVNLVKAQRDFIVFTRQAK